ncbi:MAG: glycosyltransferase family 4 protein [Candidatus Omnitrophica bacterium]|nr:glycosyltransferase family 4 protein [Candidatus Omnitrophota bacterium]
MHIAFFNRSFHPDATATGQLLTDLCEDLLRQHRCRVSVVCGPSDACRGFFFDRETYRGIEIFRAKGTRFPKRIFLGRLSNYLTYFLSSCFAGLRLDRPDLVVALTDPPIIGLAGYLTSRRFRAPLVMSYRDIFPEAGRLLENFRNPLVDWALESVNRFLVRKAGRVVALGETMRRRLIEGKGALPGKTVVIPDWADCSEITPGPKQNSFSRSEGLSEKFVVMHSGNIGLSQGLETALEAASSLQELQDLELVFVGDGVKLPDLQKKARALALRNVRFLPYQPKERLKESFASADLFIISLKKGLAGYIVPSKLYGILAAGRPYVAAVEEASEVAAITKEHQCGLLAEPGNAEDLAEKIRDLYRNPALTRRLGENARKAAMGFDRRRGVGAYYKLFSQLVKP